MGCFIVGRRQRRFQKQQNVLYFRLNVVFARHLCKWRGVGPMALIAAGKGGKKREIKIQKQSHSPMAPNAIN